MSVDYLPHEHISVIAWSFEKFRPFGMPPACIRLQNGEKLMQTLQSAPRIAQILRQMNLDAYYERYEEYPFYANIGNGEDWGYVYKAPSSENWSEVEVLSALSTFERQVSGCTEYQDSYAQTIVEELRNILIESLIDKERGNGGFITEDTIPLADEKSN